VNLPLSTYSAFETENVSQASEIILGRLHAMVLFLVRAALRLARTSGLISAKRNFTLLPKV
jgi:hypothetical protein